MPSLRSLFLPLGVCFLLGAVASGSSRVAKADTSARPPFFETTELIPPDGYGTSDPAALNDQGQVVYRATTADGRTASFLWGHGASVELGSLTGAGSTFANGISNAGLVVGAATGEDGAQHAFLWDQGQLAALAEPPGASASAATGVNSSGLIVGSATISGNSVPVIWTGPTAGATLTGLSFPDGVASAVNEAGQVVGTCWPPGGNNTSGRAFVWQAGRVSYPDPVPGYTFSEALAVSAQGAIAGAAHEPGGFHQPCMWQAGRANVLPVIRPGGAALGINDLGWAAGWSSDDGSHGFPGPPVGVLWLGGSVFDLNYWTLSAATIVRATAMNGRGQLACRRVGYDGSNGALLTPAMATVSGAISLSRSTAAVGDTVTLTATLTGNGPDDAVGPGIRYIPPPGLELISVDAPGAYVSGLTYDGEGTAEFEAVPKGQSVTARFVVRVLSAGSLTSTVYFDARNQADVPFPTASVVLTVPGSPRPILVTTWYTGIEHPYRRPAEIYADITIRNIGATTEPPMQLTVTLVAGSQPQPRDLVIAQKTVAAIAPGQSVGIDISWKIHYSILTPPVAPKGRRLRAVLRDADGRQITYLLSDPLR